MIKGRITDPNNGQVLTNTYITLYKAIGETRRRKIETIKADDGRYKFNMRPGEYYIVEAYKPGYNLGDFEFNTDDLDSGVSIDIPLERAKGYANSQRNNASSTRTNPSTTVAKPPVKTTVATPTPPVTSRPTTTYSPSNTTPASSQSTYSSSTVVSSSSASSEDTYEEGTEFRIQLTAVSAYNPMLPIFTNARKYGTLGTEMHPNGTMTRVFLRSFNTYSQAKALVETMKGYGFDTAFVVKYKNGRRVSL